MKVAIVGPVTTKSYFGGVATFDENLAIAFSKMGHKTVLLSSQSDMEIGEISNVPVRRINIFNIKEYQFDLAIFSLRDICFLNKINAECKIAFLHGFFSANYYSLLKRIAGSEYQKYFFKYADVVIANSEFTRFMNIESAGIKTDGSVRLGVSYDFLDELKKKDAVERENHSILFTGRLVSVKHVDRVLRAIKILKEEKQNYHLYVVGVGPELEALTQYSEKHDLNVTFVGKVDQKKIVKYYKRSEIFISLNESEPYGITFCEALLAGCKIVCPRTGGQVEFLRQYPNTVRILQDVSVDRLVEAIKDLFMIKLTDSVNTSDFTYERTAQEIINITMKKGK